MYSCSACAGFDFALVSASFNRARVLDDIMSEGSCKTQCVTRRRISDVPFWQGSTPPSRQTPHVTSHYATVTKCQSTYYLYQLMLITLRRASSPSQNCSILFSAFSTPNSTPQTRVFVNCGLILRCLCCGGTSTISGGWCAYWGR